MCSLPSRCLEPHGGGVDMKQKHRLVYKIIVQNGISAMGEASQEL